MLKTAEEIKLALREEYKKSFLDGVQYVITKTIRNNNKKCLVTLYKENHGSEIVNEVVFEINKAGYTCETIESDDAFELIIYMPCCPVSRINILKKDYKTINDEF